MMKLRPALQNSEGRSLPWSGSVLCNMFSEMGEGDKVSQFAIMAIPGLVQLSNIGTLPVRGLHRMGSTLYAVVGVNLYSIASNGTATSLGTVLGNNPVRMADNGQQIAIVGGTAGTTGYVYSGGTVTASPINLPAVSDVTYIDGYFVWSAANSDQFIISAIDDGLTYDPLDVATVEGNPDYIVGVVNDHRELHFYGVDSTEIWYNSGDADFPFARQGNAFIERGCQDRDSIVKADSTVIFVDNRRSVCRLDGYAPVIISTPSVASRLAKGAYYRAWTYAEEGHEFYVISTDLTTEVYDFSTRLWHQRASYQSDTYRIGSAQTAYGKTIFGDATTGKLYLESLDYLDEAGKPIICKIGLPTIERNRDLLTMYALELYAETGVGTLAEPNPQVNMRYSRDGGRTWSNDMTRPLGVIGDYKSRAVWRPGIQFRSLQVEFTMPSSVRRFVMSYLADVR